MDVVLVRTLYILAEDHAREMGGMPQDTTVYRAAKEIERLDAQLDDAAVHCTFCGNPRGKCYHCDNVG